MPTEPTEDQSAASPAHAAYKEAIKDGAIAPPEVTAAAMDEQGVERQSELHDLFGKKITYDGLDAVIDYAIGERFRCKTEPAPVKVTHWQIVQLVDKAGKPLLDKQGAPRKSGRFVTEERIDNRAPWGLIADIKIAADGSLSYTTPAEMEG